MFCESRNLCQEDEKPPTGCRLMLCECVNTTSSQKQRLPGLMLEEEGRGGGGGDGLRLSMERHLHNLGEGFRKRGMLAI